LNPRVAGSRGVVALYGWMGVPAPWCRVGASGKPLITPVSASDAQECLRPPMTCADVVRETELSRIVSSLLRR
jgi:hypothetical protein